jgi:hypothetical protein
MAALFIGAEKDQIAKIATKDAMPIYAHLSGALKVGGAPSASSTGASGCHFGARVSVDMVLPDTKPGAAMSVELVIILLPELEYVFAEAV